MSTMQMQPTFRQEIGAPINDAILRIRRAMAIGDLGRYADAAGNCLDFRVPPDERRLWSPHLSVQIDEVDDRVELFGRFAPRPEVWTFVMFVYFAAAFVAICGTVYGCVQWMFAATPWAFAAVPAGMLAILALHLMSVAGQRLSADQMQHLRERLDRVLAEAFEDDSAQRAGANVETASAPP